MRCAFLGVGLLGSAIATRAAEVGNTVVAWNRTGAKADALSVFGISSAATPAEAVKGAQFVHITLCDDESVDSVVALARVALSPDAIIIDHTTTAPEKTRVRAERLASEGVKYLHCPVFMGPVGARTGSGTIIASGPRELFEAAEPLLRSLCSRLEFLGVRADLAAVNKLCGNAFFLWCVSFVVCTRTRCKPCQFLTRHIHIRNTAAAHWYRTSSPWLRHKMSIPRMR